MTATSESAPASQPGAMPEDALETNRSFPFAVKSADRIVERDQFGFLFLQPGMSDEAMQPAAQTAERPFGKKRRENARSRSTEERATSIQEPSPMC